MHWSVLANGGKGFEAQAAFGDVHYPSTVISFQLQEGKLIRDVSQLFAAFQVYISQGHDSREARFIFGTSFNGREVKVCRIGGPRAGAGPSLLTPRPPLYSSAPGMKLTTAHRAEKKFLPLRALAKIATSDGRAGVII
jgi:hypothetical protein